MCRARGQVADALQGLARGLDAGVGTVEDGHGAAGVEAQDFSAVRGDRALDPVRTALGCMSCLVLTDALGKGLVPVVEGDEDAQILSLGHRRQFRFRSDGCGGGWGAAPDARETGPQRDAGCRPRHGGSVPVSVARFVLERARPDQAHGLGARRGRQFDRIEGGVAFLDHGLLRQADEVEQARIGQVRGHHVLQ